jgi:hypothetical protein
VARSQIPGQTGAVGHPPLTWVVGRVLHVGTFKGVVAPILHLLNGS